jgi:hypothetical protein
MQAIGYEIATHCWRSVRNDKCKGKKKKSMGNRGWDCRAMTLKFLVDGFWFFVERQRQKMWV